MIRRFLGFATGLLCRLMLLLACVVTVAVAAAVILRYPAAGWVVLLLLIWKITRRGFGSGWLHGTATLADWPALLPLLGDKGEILASTGNMSPVPRGLAFRYLLAAPLRRSVLAAKLFLASLGKASPECVIRVPDSVHLATFAKTRGGKGVSVVIPTLLSYRESMVTLDPKGENYRLTGKFRKRRFGHRVVVLAPWSSHSDTFNPLDMIDHKSPDFIDQCKDLAAALVVRSGRELDSHWLDSSERFLQAVIAFVCVAADAETRNLQTVCAILASKERFTATVAALQQAGGVAGGMLERLGHSLSWPEAREMGSIQSTIQRMLSFLNSPVVAANTSKSSFDPRDLRKGKMSIYLSLPLDRVSSHAALQRMWISSIMGAIVRGGGDESRKTLWMLDEIGNIGHLQILEDAVSMYAGLGVKLWFIWQSLDQVKKCFGERASTVLDNISTQQYFGINDFETAEALSKKVGEGTFVQLSEQDGSSDSYNSGFSAHGQNPGSRSTSRSSTRSEVARKLLKPEEITRMHPDMCVMFHNERPPILGKLIRYYRSPLFRSPLLRRLRPGTSPGLGLGGVLGSATVLLLSLSLTLLPALLQSVRLPRMAAHAVSQPPVHRNQLGLPSLPGSEYLMRGYNPPADLSPRIYRRIHSKPGYAR